mmetsp:Transcript_57725/g.160927  ORF Transcript_57725/g.160927 Transcript_57725/m.160927 type:complete len:220 (-) Transcript_57725:927-1586(-)
MQLRLGGGNQNRVHLGLDLGLGDFGGVSFGGFRFKQLLVQDLETRLERFRSGGPNGSGAGLGLEPSIRRSGAAHVLLDFLAQCFLEGFEPRFLRRDPCLRCRYGASLCLRHGLGDGLNLGHFGLARSFLHHLSVVGKLCSRIKAWQRLSLVLPVIGFDLAVVKHDHLMQRRRRRGDRFGEAGRVDVYAYLRSLKVLGDVQCLVENSQELWVRPVLRGGT